MSMSSPKKLVGMAVFLGAALLLASATASAVSYDPDTTITIYVHGFDTEGYTFTGTYGDDPVGLGVANDINQFAAVSGLPTWETDPDAPNQIAGCEYYGAVPPSWYTLADINEDETIGGYVPRYALRTAKYIQHVLDRAPTATAVNLIAGSFGGEITRYMIEHDLCGLASSQMIARWNPVVGVIAGNYAATNAPLDLVDLLGYASPDMYEMDYDWVNENISARTTMNTNLYAHMIITQFIATDDTDGLLTGFTGGSYANDSVCLCKDSKFSGYTTTAALHAATDGTLQMGGYSYQHCLHQDIADSAGAWAGILASSRNNQRVTIKMTRIKAYSSGDSWIQGRGEWAFQFSAISPMANTLYGCTAPMTDIRWSDGVLPMISLNKNETKYPNIVLFDQIVPAGETQLQLTFEPEELDYFFNFYNVIENPFGSNKSMGVTTATLPVDINSTVTLISGYYEIDLTTTVKYVY